MSQSPSPPLSVGRGFHAEGKGDRTREGCESSLHLCHLSGEDTGRACCVRVIDRVQPLEIHTPPPKPAPETCLAPHTDQTQNRLTRRIPRSVCCHPFLHKVSKWPQKGGMRDLTFHCTEMSPKHDQNTTLFYTETSCPAAVHATVRSQSAAGALGSHSGVQASIGALDATTSCEPSAAKSRQDSENPCTLEFLSSLLSSGERFVS